MPTIADLLGLVDAIKRGIATNPLQTAKDYARGGAGNLADLVDMAGGAFASPGMNQPQVGPAVRGLLGNTGVPTEQAGSLLGLPVSTGAKLGMLAAGKTAPLVGLLGQMVYHGTPHNVTRYDLAKIGTGEGAQAYGHGMYFAENPSVALDYKNRLSVAQDLEDASKEWPRYIKYGEKTIDTRMPSGRMTPEETAITYVAANYGDKVQAIRDLAEWKGSGVPDESRYIAAHGLLNGGKIDIGKVKPQYGNLYAQDLPDEVLPKLLQWDKPLSEQPENVRAAFSKLGFDVENVKFKTPDALHKAGYKYLSSPEATRLVNTDLNAAEDISAARKIWNQGPSSFKDYTDSSEGAWLRGLLTKARAGDQSGGSALGLLMDKNGGFGAWTGQGGGQVVASQKLRDLGVPGLSYFDAGSRAGGKGTMNHVIWDQGLLDQMTPTPYTP